jgi:hypothetical protein
LSVAWVTLAASPATMKTCQYCVPAMCKCAIETRTPFRSPSDLRWRVDDAAKSNTTKRIGDDALELADVCQRRTELHTARIPEKRCCHDSLPPLRVFLTDPRLGLKRRIQGAAQLRTERIAAQGAGIMPMLCRPAAETNRRMREHYRRLGQAPRF